jgi:hypothetical protein
MNRVVKLCFVLALLLPVSLMAQNDSFRLICPLNDETLVPPPKNAIKYDETDFCIVLVSISDTVVKAVYNGRITNVEFDEETKNGVVMYAKINNKDYYFWYTGMNKLLVHRNETVKAGQTLGFISPGAKIELLMYQFETPVDATKYLDCKGLIKEK